MTIISHAFSHHRPATIPETIGLLSELESRAVYAGGTELLQVMKAGLAEFDHLIDIKRVTGLGRLEVHEDSIIVGATITHYRLSTDPAIAAAFPLLASVADGIGNIRVRVTGTLGGNLCFGEPHSDPLTLLIAMGADVRLHGAAGERTMAVERFVLAPFTTALTGEELLVGVRIPLPPPSTRVTYEKIVFTERPVASVACRLDAPEGGPLEWTVTIGSVGDMPVTISMQAERRDLAAEDVAAAERLAELAMEGCGAVTDQYGSEDYKRHIVGVLVRRAVQRIGEGSRV